MDNKDVVHIYNGMLFSHKKNEILPLTWIDLEIVILNKSERQRQTLYHFTCMWNLNNKMNKYKQSQRYKEKQMFTKMETVNIETEIVIHYVCIPETNMVLKVTLKTNQQTNQETKDQICDFSEAGLWEGELDEGNQKAGTSSCKKNNY